MVRTASESPWSSYRATVGEADCPDWLQRDGLLAAFGTTEAAAVLSYRRLVADGANQPSPWEEVKHQAFLGSETFVEALQRTLSRDRDRSEIPRAQRRPRATPLADDARAEPQRDDAIVAAYAGGGHTMKAIGDDFGLHY